ncbi:hypothetical protein, partial [Mycobacterium ulcerans]|uniref:hypothetical protein n=1 Tax=Mycobacterium ulcerans TaxID=1809 RepID=UPI001E3FC6E4
SPGRSPGSNPDLVVAQNTFNLAQIPLEILLFIPSTMNYNSSYGELLPGRNAAYRHWSPADLGVGNSPEKEL